DPNLAVGDATFVRVGASQLRASASAGGLNFGLNVGFLGAQVVAGAIDLSAAAAIQLPAADLSLSQLQGGSLAALGATVTGSGGGAITLPVQASVGGTALSAAPIPITLSAADIFAAAPATPGALPDALKVFTNVSGSDILQALGRL